MPEALPNASTGTKASDDGPQSTDGHRSKRPRIPPAVSACLLLILIGAALLRTLQLRDLPAGLFCDEAAFGYNAWAILHHGVDENGVRLPLFLWSFTGYKNPVYLYAAMLPIGVLGLDEFSLRLTSAAFGVATILALFFAGRKLGGNAAGLAAAALLAICPWHIHFSRIAFELISFPLLFLIGLNYLLRFVRGDKTLPAAFFFLGSCLYAYAIAKLFIPLFLVGFGLLYLPTVWRRFREWLVAVPVLLATVTPVVLFDYVHRERGNAYFRNASILGSGRSLPELIRLFGRNYIHFFSPRFLFQQGDEIVRHAVRDHGELYPFFAPLLVIGVLVLLFKRERPGKLALVWLALYPVGASIMNEIPSATRGFIGVAAFCLVAGIGVAAILELLERIGRRRWIVLTLQAVGLATLSGFAAVQTARYVRLYWHEYNTYAAATYGGFQYGYRDSLATMEPQRPKYPLLMLTATEVNQPQIFPLFYNRVDPRLYSRTGNPGYLVLVPEEYGRYNLDRPILYALRKDDLAYFSDYTVQKEIRAPGGQLEFLVTEVRARKNYVTSWQTLGLFDNRAGAGVEKDFLDVASIAKRQYVTRDGPAFWRLFTPAFVKTDWNALFRRDNGEAPNDVCAYALTVPKARTPGRALLELSGSDTPTQVWWNGQRLTPSAASLGASPTTLAIALVHGDNTLVVKSCKSSGAWFLLARIVSPDGKDLTDLSYGTEIPEGPVPARPPESGERQVVEGFASIAGFRHDGPYPDYRGGSASWWAYRDDDRPEVRWLTAPVPRQLTTTAAFTGSLSDEAGPAELWVNGIYALTFETGSGFRSRSWQRGGYRLTFQSKQVIAGNSGVFLLTVPPSVVSPGHPLDLRVVPVGNSGKPWFMIKGLRDTAAFERITPETASAVRAP